MDVVSRGIVVPFFLWMKQQRISAVVNLGASKSHRYALPRGHPSKSLGTHSRSCRCLGHNGGYGTPMAHGPSQSNVHIEYLCILYIYMYIYYMHMHMYLYICICMCTCIFILVFIFLEVIIYIYNYSFTFICLFVCLFICLYIC
jgi:hypothetical protein